MRSLDNALVALGVIILLVFFGAKRLSKTDIGDNTSTLSKKSSEKNSTPTSSENLPNQPNSLPTSSTRASSLKEEKANIIINNTNSGIVASFEKSAAITLPNELKNIAFESLIFDGDKDSGVIGMVAKNQLNGASIAIINSKSNHTEDELKSFIKSDISKDLGIQISDEDLAKPESIKPQTGSGLTDVSAWTIVHGSEITVISIAKRTDGNGLYMTILNGNDSVMKSNETYFESILGQIKVK